MALFRRDKKHKYVAKLSHVREVALLGCADLGFWILRLRSERLAPIEFDGRARILISVIQARFLGVKFRELCIAVEARKDEDVAGEDGFYFVQGFSSSRFFAAVERVLYSTPYLNGQIVVDARLPTSIALKTDSGGSFRAEMSFTTARSEPLRTGSEGWERPIYLPTNSPGSTGKQFFAKVGGHTQTYAFSPRHDVVAFGDSAKSQALGWLIESGFSAQEWSIRKDATHARSKTCVTCLS